MIGVPGVPSDRGNYRSAVGAYADGQLMRLTHSSLGVAFSDHGIMVYSDYIVWSQRVLSVDSASERRSLFVSDGADVTNRLEADCG